MNDELITPTGKETTEQVSHDKPFIIELERVDSKPGGYFRPHATIKLTPSLRTSGFLLSLPPEEVKSLLFLLTFIHPNGHCTPTLKELSHAMHISEAKVRARMQRLASIKWQGETLAVEIKRENGLDAFSPTPNLIEVREQKQLCPHCGNDTSLPPVDRRELASAQQRRREQIVSLSRERFARPRAEVEQMMAEQMGWDVPEREDDSEDTKVRRRLGSLGVTRDQVDELLSNHELGAIQQQIEWLPYRRAKNPAAFLVAAIEGTYEAPLAIRHQTDAKQDTSAIEVPSTPEQGISKS